jgi:hypothetical protein
VAVLALADAHLAAFADDDLLWPNTLLPSALKSSRRLKPTKMTAKIAIHAAAILAVWPSGVRRTAKALPTSTSISSA